MAITLPNNIQAGQSMSAAPVMANFNQIINNPVALWSPAQTAMNFNGQTMTLDAAGVTTVVSSAASAWNFTTGAKTGTPSSTGGFVNYSASTYTDSNTAGSGTAAQWAGFAIQRPTLAASNTSVTTTDAASLYVANAPAAGTNETLTNAWAIQVGAGNVKFPGTSNNLGTITTGVWNGTLIGPAYGGTGVANNAASTLAISGAYATTLTVTGVTGVTLPTTGTLATLAGAEALSNKTYNGNTVTAGTGTLTLGAGSTLATSATNSITLTSTGATNVTLPTTGTLATTSNKLSAFAATTSAELAGVISDETGTGAVVFANSPTLVTPALGTPSAVVLTNASGTAASLTAGTVTTNANLTGDVTSVGNATTLSAGARLLSKVVSATRDTSLASGTQDVTGFGFDPTAVIVLCTSSTGNPDMSIGIVDSAAGQGRVQQNQAGNVDVSTNAITFTQTAAGSYDGTIALITDGVRITWTKTSSPTSTINLKILGFR